MSIPEVVLKDRLLNVSKTITGVSVQNERGVDKIVVDFFHSDYLKQRLTLPIAVARMLRTALGTMTILDEEEENDSGVQRQG